MPRNSSPSNQLQQGGSRTGTGSPTQSPPQQHGGGSVVPRARYNEILAENHSLRARLTSSNEELAATREIFASAVGTGGVKASGCGDDGVMNTAAGKGLSLRWLSQVPLSSSPPHQRHHDDTDANSTTDGAAADELRSFRLALSRKEAECEELRQQLQLATRSPLEASQSPLANSSRRRGSSRVSHGSKSPPGGGVGPTIVSVTTTGGGDDAGSLSEGPVGGGSDDALVCLLQGALQQAKGQLRQALEELASVSSKYRLLIASSSEKQQQRNGSSATEGSADDPRPTPSTSRNKEEEELWLVAKEAARLFRLYDRAFTVPEITRLLEMAEGHSHQDPSVAEDGDAEREGLSPTARQKATMQHISASLALREELDACQAELVAAHERIDELLFALDLEQRHVAQLRFNQMQSSNNADVLINSEAAKQAAEEIAFLCDTLAATREEADRLEKSLQTAKLERDAALAAFSELKQRSEEVLVGCHEISETARLDADSSIQVVMSHLKAKEKELHLLRNQFAQHKIVFDDVKKGKMALEKELIETKTKNLSLKEVVTKLQEDHRRSTVTISDLKARVASLKAQAAQQQQQQHFGTDTDLVTTTDQDTAGEGRSRSAGGARRATSSSRRRVASAASSKDERTPKGGPEQPQQLPDELSPESAASGEDGNNVMTERSRKRSVSGKKKRAGSSSPAAPASTLIQSPHRDLTGNIPRSFLRNGAAGAAAAKSSSSPKVSSSRSLKVMMGGTAADSETKLADDQQQVADQEDGGINYRAEYEEMKSCLLLLAPKVPGATTARDVTTGLLDGLEKITVHCQKVETELRKKSTQFQVLKRQHAETKEQVEALERKVAHVAVLEKKIEGKDRLLDKTKKEHASALSELTKQRHALDAQVVDKAVEIERLRAELAVAQMELTEGRELMLQLIKESEASRANALQAGASSPSTKQ